MPSLKSQKIESANAVEKRIVLKNAGVINPDSIDEYIGANGYKALKKVLSSMAPDEVIAEIKKSELRERNAQGLYVGDRWELANKAAGENKVLICNADGGEPGNFKDIVILESDPHNIIESMTIAGYAIGAHKGYVYIRGEHHQSTTHFEKALIDAKSKNFLGADILGSGFEFDIEVFKGIGAYTAGEESALIESMEGKRGESRNDYPDIVFAGLNGEPTIINNIETIANTAQIILNGAEWFAEIGTEQSKGTKIFTTCGDVLSPGIYEVPFGASLRELIFSLSGGMKSGNRLKAVLIGGLSGICVNDESLDRELSYEDMNPGAGALIVADSSRCIVDMMQNIAEYFANESCGQCIPCKEGTKRILEMMNFWIHGVAVKGDFELAVNLGETMAIVSKCGLGRVSTTAFRSSIPLFNDEYQSHITEGICPANVCEIEIDKE